jgi:hypothetical protein
MKTAGVGDVRGLANQLRARGEELVVLAERVNVLCGRADNPTVRRELRRLCPGMLRLLVRIGGPLAGNDEGGMSHDPNPEVPAPAIHIRTGGQTGVDRAALDFAVRKGIPYGGWCPPAAGRRISRTRRASWRSTRGCRRRHPRCPSSERPGTSGTATRH